MEQLLNAASNAFFCALCRVKKLRGTWARASETTANSRCLKASSWPACMLRQQRLQAAALGQSFM